MNPEDGPRRPGQPLGGGGGHVTGNLERLPEPLRVTGGVGQRPGGFVQHEQVCPADGNKLVGGRRAAPVHRVEVEVIVQNRRLCHGCVWGRARQKRFSVGGGSALGVGGLLELDAVWLVAVSPVEPPCGLVVGHRLQRDTVDTGLV